MSAPSLPGAATPDHRHLVRISWSTAAAMVIAGLVTAGAFGWPFLIPSAGGGEGASHGADAPWLFVLVLPLLVLVVLAEVSAGGLDAKAVALLGMLSAVGGGLRALSPGIAGLEPSFALLLVGGRVFGRGFGFVQGALTIVVGALLTGGVGPWLPFQMMAAGWVGFVAGCLPRGRGTAGGGSRAEVWMLTGLGFVLGLAFGALMNLWFWPFGDYGADLSYVAGARPAANLEHYTRYYLTTSLVWDLTRGFGTAVILLVAGRPLLRALRRVARMAAFDAPVAFAPHPPGAPPDPSPATD